MKNTIPLILAVVVGLAAVFAVNRTITRNRGDNETKIHVLVASRDLSSGTELQEADLGSFAIPMSTYISHQHVRASDMRLVVGQKLQRDIPRNGYVLLDAVKSSVTGLSGEVTKGEWGVPVHFADSTLIPALQVGDEIAIVMIVQDKVASGKNDEEGNEEYIRLQTSRVLFPMVRVLRKTQDGILVSLNPQDAQVLLMAQLTSPLYPMLRRRGDTQNRKIEKGKGVTQNDLSEDKLFERNHAN